MALPADMLFGLIDLQNGLEPTEYWLGTDNFFAITKYNRSFFYAMSVVDLGRAVRAARSR
jgi:membrane-bound lytic murein transglycosylase B